MSLVCKIKIYTECCNAIYTYTHGAWDIFKGCFARKFQSDGFSHTFIGASLLAIVSAISGKYLSQIALWILKIEKSIYNQIQWSVVILSAFIGSFSHVFLDAIMHSDVQPFYPLTLSNPLLELISISTLHKFCLYSGLLGAAIYYFLQCRYRL